MTTQGTESFRVDAEGSLTRFAADLHSPDALRREEAARQLWLRFSDRLAAEVRHRLNAQILRRAGMEDVVNSLFASFVAAAPGPGGPPRNRAELWRLLVRFTVCKVANTAKRHRAKRCDVRREVLLGDLAGLSETRAFEPEDRRVVDPADEAVAREEFDRLLAVLPSDSDLREVFVMRVEGLTNAEIAARIGRVERTVELRMRTIRALLHPQIDADGATGV